MIRLPALKGNLHSHGVNDLLELLSLFGGEFAEENLHVNESETSAIYQVDGLWNYMMCQSKCSELPSGKWRMIDMQTLSEFRSQLPTANVWLSNEELIHVDGSAIKAPYIAWSGQLMMLGTGYSETCVCETHERPKVEYTYCRKYDEGGDPTTFATCAQEKVEDGWCPLGGISSYRQNGNDYIGQAFWRWAE